MVSSSSVCLAQAFALLLALLLTPSANAGDSQQRLIDAGREQFTRVRQVFRIRIDERTDADLFFNAQSCAECHKLGGVGGAGPNENNVQMIDGEAISAKKLAGGLVKSPRTFAPPPSQTRLWPDFFAPFDPASKRWPELELDSAEPVGPMLPRRSTQPNYAARRLRLLQPFAPSHPELATGSQVESRPFRKVDEINTPPLFGLGLIESISQRTINDIAKGQPADVRGQSVQRRDDSHGRFGWRAQIATLGEFNESACAAELGLKTPNFTPAKGLVVSGRAPKPESWMSPKPAKNDMESHDLVALTAFVKSLPRPHQVIPPGRENEVAAGERLFKQAGCAECHVPDVDLVTGVYSDLLLHNVGTVRRKSSGVSHYQGSIVRAFDQPPELPPPTPFDHASAVRTPPLWGVADSAPYLHDGSAATLDSAIARHSEQAKRSAEHYQRKLSYAEKRSVLEFLGTLRAPKEPAANTTAAAAKPASSP